MVSRDRASGPPRGSGAVQRSRGRPAARCAPGPGPPVCPVWYSIQGEGPAAQAQRRRPKGPGYRPTYNRSDPVSDRAPEVPEGPASAERGAQARRASGVRGAQPTERSVRQETPIDHGQLTVDL